MWTLLFVSAKGSRGINYFLPFRQQAWSRTGINICVMPRMLPAGNSINTQIAW